MKKFNELYRTIEYPSKAQKILGLRSGIGFDYVCSDYLDAFINCVRPVKMFLLGSVANETRIKVTEVHMDPPFSYQYKKLVNPTKEEAVTIYSEPGRLMHTKLHMFGDDILILGRIEAYSKYVFFWYCLDNSDCSIARICWENSEQELAEMFEEFCKERSLKLTDSLSLTEIPVHALRGTVKW
jgi:hypothetical protein